jgi:hypothetical protein
MIRRGLKLFNLTGCELPPKEGLLRWGLKSVSPKIQYPPPQNGVFAPFTFFTTFINWKKIKSMLWGPKTFSPGDPVFSNKKNVNEKEGVKP